MQSPANIPYAASSKLSKAEAMLADATVIAAMQSHANITTATGTALSKPQAMPTYANITASRTDAKNTAVTPAAAAAAT